MLDYVNSLNQKRGVSRRTLACLAISCFLHFCMIMTLYLFPALLAGGYLHEFRGFRWRLSGDSDENAEQWRVVTVIDSSERMNMPSLETLRKSLGSGDKDEGAGSPPIEVSFSPPGAPETDKPPLPQIPPEIEEPEVVIPIGSRPGTDDETNRDNESSGGELSPTEPADPGTGTDIFAAKPDTAPEVEVAAAGDTVPRKIPDGIKPPAAPAKSAPPPAAESDGAPKPGVRSGIEFLNAGGFPLGEYRKIIEGLVRARWARPSNIKGSQLRTIVVFYIDRKGSVSGLSVERSSGNKSLDSAALSAIWGVAFPPLPRDFPRESLGVRLIMVDD